MTVTANTTRNDYVGNGQSVYSYTFQLNDASDVTVYLDGVVQTLNTHYTVENVGVGSGGTITFTLVDENNNPIHPTSSQAISIVMAMDLDRDTNYQQSGLFAASDVNNDFDRLWLASNQQQTAINRSLRLQDDDATTGNMELPSKDDRKGKLLGFNATTGLPETSDNNNSNWNAAYNNMITSASFSGGNYTLTQQDGGTISTSLDGRYLPLSGGTLTGNLVIGSGRISLPNLDIYKDVYDTSVIEETGLGHLIIKGTDVRIQTSNGEDVIQGQANGAVTLYYDNTAKLATTNTGISVTGTLSATGYNDTNWNTAYNDKINSVDFTSVDNTLTLTQQDGTTLTTVINGSLTGGGETLAQTLTIGNTTGGNDISFGDNDKAKFGASNDLQIYHTGSESRIEDAGTGLLTLRSQGTGIQFWDTANGGYMLNSTVGGAVDLYHNRSKKLATTSTGIDVTGGIVIDTNPSGHSVDEAIRIDDGGSTVDRALQLFEYHDTGARYHSISFNTHTTSNGSNFVYTQGNYGGSSSIQFANAGNISFFTDNQVTSGSTTNITPSERLRITSDGNVGIGTSSPTRVLDVSKSGSTILANFKNTGGTTSFITLGNTTSTADQIRVGSNGTALTLSTNYAERMRIDSSGRVGIGTSLVGTLLHVSSGTTNNIANDTSEVRFIGADKPLNLEQANVVIQTNDDMAVNKGGSIGFGGRATAGSTNGNNFAHIGGRKENATSGNYAGYLSFGTSDSISDVHERMRIDSSGNVGIGTNSPARPLTVNGLAGFRNSTTGFATSDGFDIGVGGSDAYIVQRENANIIIETNGAERMRIDSSGNLSVGTTANPSGTVEGIRAASNGVLYAASVGTAPLVLYRHDSDGNILNFHKDGASVGSIGTASGTLVVGSTNGSGSYLKFGSNVVAPVDTNGAVRDNAIDLGQTNARFKDLYLSGSINASGLTYPTADGTANQVMVTDGSGNLSFASRSLWGANNLQYIGSSNVLVSQNTPTGNTTTAKLNIFNGNSGITPDSNSTVFLDSSGNNTLQMGSGTYNSAALYFGNPFSASRAGIEVSHGGGSMAFRNYGFEAMRLNSSGNLGVGTSTPSAKITAHGGGSAVSTPSGVVIQGRNTNSSAYLHLVSNIYGSAGIYLGDSSDVDRAGVIYSNYNDRLDFNANASTRMSISSAGNVGINTTTPLSPLDINDNRLRIRDSKTPASATATGNKGEICYDSNYMYVCVATNTWKRAALASW